MPLTSSLGRALVEPSLHPETVMNCTVQAYKKEGKRFLSQIAGKGERECLNCPLAQTPLGINPNLDKSSKLKQQENPVRHLTEEL